MTSDAEIVIAFLYKRSGKEELSFSELYLNLSMELNWFTPDEAKDFVNLTIKQGLLIKKGEIIKPNFDFNKIVVPVGFTPSKNIFEKKEVEEIKDEGFFEWQGVEDYGLTKREKEIVELICGGLSNKEISEKLFISLQTVKDHNYNIFRKVDVSNRVQLTRKFINRDSDG